MPFCVTWREVAGLNTESVRAAIEERTRVAVAAGASSITVDGVSVPHRRRDVL